MDTIYARHPDRLNSIHPILIDEFIELNLVGKDDGVSEMIHMLEELRKYGRKCRFIKNLKGTPLMELKPQARGGMKGGARVYFWITPDDVAAVVNCEVKEPDAPASRQQLGVALQVYLAHHEGVDVFAEPAAQSKRVQRNHEP